MDLHILDSEKSTFISFESHKAFISLLGCKFHGEKNRQMEILLIIKRGESKKMKLPLGCSQFLMRPKRPRQEL